MQKIANIKMCNAWGAKCNMMHDQEHLNHINLYKILSMVCICVTSHHQIHVIACSHDVILDLNPIQ
jgi:hypothetical protein